MRGCRNIGVRAGTGKRKDARQFQVYKPSGLTDKTRSRFPLMPFRLRPKFSGLFQDEIALDSFWIREQGQLALPSLEGIGQLTITGEILPPPENDPTAAGSIGLEVKFDDRTVARQDVLPVGPFRLEVPIGTDQLSSGHTLTLRLAGVTGGNLLAWLG